MNQRPCLGFVLIALTALITMASCEGQPQPAEQTPAAVAKQTDYQVLVKLHQDFLALQMSRTAQGAPDYSRAAIDARKKDLEDLKTRFATIDPLAWPVPQKVDYLLARAELNGMDFDFRVLKPWERDPGLYVDLVALVPFAELPAKDAAALRAHLQAVPAILEQGKANLTGATGDLSALALRHLERSDGVNQGEPRRATPPEGVIGWYEDFLARLPNHHADLVPVAKQAQAAVVGFRDWMKQNQAAMNAPTSIGGKNYDWYVKNVRLMPFTATQIALMGDQEWWRTATFLKLEEHRNRMFPPIKPATTAEDHERRVRDAETLIRTFTKEHSLITFPADIPPTFETDAYWIVRPEGRHFWEQITYRDPLNNHLHASIPGHAYEGVMHRRDTRPIRGSYSDSGRAEGWCFYVEEMYLQMGLLDKRPHAKELFYIAQLWRALRVPTEIRMLTANLSVDQAVKDMMAEIPFMDENLGRYDLEGYVRRPTSGMIYTIGKIQVQRLFTDRARQLGAKFNVGQFHDEFLAAGMIPISLIRWEMTGHDDEVRLLWPEGFATSAPTAGAE